MSSPAVAPFNTAGHLAVPRVLSLGHEEILLMTRRRLLEQEGCAFFGATSLGEFHAYLLGNSFDIILLCQSITSEECAVAAELARTHAPHARLLVMFTPTEMCTPAGADVLLDAQTGPKIFVETARHLLTLAN